MVGGGYWGFSALTVCAGNRVVVVSVRKQRASHGETVGQPEHLGDAVRMRRVVEVGNADLRAQITCRS